MDEIRPTAAFKDAEASADVIALRQAITNTISVYDVRGDKATTVILALRAAVNCKMRTNETLQDFYDRTRQATDKFYEWGDLSKARSLRWTRSGPAPTAGTPPPTDGAWTTSKASPPTS